MTEGRTSDWSGEDYAAQADHHRSFDDWFLDRLPPQKGDVVVDLGCGSGEFTARVAELVTEGRVIGVEPDPSMLEAARRHDQPRLEFVRASAQDLEEVVERESVDKVMSRAMLHWLPVTSYQRVFEAVLGVLRPGGWFHSESRAPGTCLGCWPCSTTWRTGSVCRAHHRSQTPESSSISWNRPVS